MAQKRAVLVRLVERFFAHRRLYPMIPLMGIVRNKLLPTRARNSTPERPQCRVSTHLST